MRVIIIAGGDFFCDGKITAEDYVICADSGYDSAKKNGIYVNLLMGDMDSVKGDISNENDKILFPVRKDYTDTELAIDKALEMNPDEIVLLGCTGTRVDHSLANIFLLRSIYKRGVKAYIQNEHNKIYYYKDYFELNDCVGKTVSLIPLTEKISGITTKGLDYPLDNETLYFGETRGISNVVVEAEWFYKSHSGEGFIIINDGV